MRYQLQLDISVTCGIPTSRARVESINQPKSILHIILDPDLECHLLTFNRLLVFCHILSATGE